MKAKKAHEQYVIKDINPTLKNLIATANTFADPVTSGDLTRTEGISFRNLYDGLGGATAQGRFDRAPNEKAIEAEHIIHTSLTEGLRSQLASWYSIPRAGV